MNRGKKEKQIEELGLPWSRTMEVYKQARDKQLELVDSSTQTVAIQKYWRKYHQKHYEKLLRTILKLAKRRKQSGKPAAKRELRTSLRAH
jgi:hypothetical protein